MVLQYGKRRVAYSSRQAEIYRDLGFKPSQTTSDNASVRVDHNFSQSEILAVRYTFNRYQDPNFDHTDFLPGLGGTGTSQRRQNASLQLTSVIDPKLVNNFRLGGNRINCPLTCEGVLARRGGRVQLL